MTTDRPKEAEPLLRRALGIDEKVYGPDHPEVAIDLSSLAHLLLKSNRLEDAALLAKRCVDISHASLGAEQGQKLRSSSMELFVVNSRIRTLPNPSA
jgi:hypothetical protein